MIFRNQVQMLFILVLPSSAEYFFKDVPGRVPVDPGGNATMLWTLSDAFAERHSLKLYRSTIIANLLHNPNGEIVCQNYSRVSCQIINTTRVGFTLHSIQPFDAGNYPSLWQIKIPSTDTWSNGTLIYVFQRPTTPTITGLKDVVIGNEATLICESSSQSLPMEFRNLSRIEYSWTSDLSSGNLNAGGNTVTIGPVERGENGVNVTCTARDQGSILSVSSTVSINVLFLPGKPKITVNNMTLWERRHDLTLTCSFGPGQGIQDGNPQSHNFTWRNTDTNYVSPVTVSELTINKADLSVSLHDGTWTCTPHNTVGTGGTGQITITVNAEPILLGMPKNLTTDVNSELNMTCSFKSKPAANIRWKNSSRENTLPESLKVVSSSFTRNRYTVTVSTISWLPGSGSVDRCKAGGEYRCSAHNGEDDVDSSVITFTAQCAPHLINRTKDKAANLGENHTFEAHFIANPKPTNVTSWTFITQSGTKVSFWPSNIEVSKNQINQQLTFSTAIHITNISELNYGRYLLDNMSNSLGGPGSLKFVLSPEGPPHTPSDIREMYETAISLKFNWTAGFNGGFPQTFSVLYRAEGERDESSAVDHQPNVSTGDVIIFKLKDSKTVLPDTVYYITIRAQNGYNGGSEVHGNPIESRTKVRPVLLEPVIEINSSHAVIKAIIQNKKSVTHIITAICPKEDVSICSQQNTSVVLSDITIILRIEAQARQYNVSFTLYDRDDEVNKSSVIAFPKSGGMSLMLKAGIGGGVSVAVLIILIITVVLCCRRKRETEKKRSRESHPTARIDEVGISGMDNGPSTTNGKKKHIPVDDIPYEDTEVKSGILVTKFAAYVDQILQTKKPFEQEYGSLPQDQQFEWTAALRDDDLKDKNRFKNILPYDKNRVELLTRQGYPLSDYINASYIKRYSTQDKYIATLGPMPETVDDFWRMVWEKDVPLIVMLTTCRELGGKKKCEQYWPVTIGAGPVFHSNIKIYMIKEDIWLDYTIRTFSLKKKGEERTVYHCHFTSWPDHGVPDCGTALIAFRGIVVKKMVPNCYTIMHCSAGVGRTGTLIALDYLIKQGEQEKHVDVFSCVKQLRMQRVHMIQTLAQYVFLHEALSEYFSAGPTNIPCVDFINTYTKINKPVRSGLSKIAMEMKELDKLSPTIREADQDYPHEGVNFDKNRDPSIIPLLSSRVFLSSRVPDRNDYINAVDVSTLQRKDAFIVTQVPLEDTVIDFWRLIMEFNSSTIVLLATDQQYKMMPKFIPISENQCVTLNGITARRIGETIKKGFTELEIDISPASPMENVYMNAPHIVQSGEAASIQNKSMRLFCVNLAKNKPCVDPVSTLSLITEVNHWKDTGAQVPIVVVCWDGATYSGQFVASYSLVEMMSAEQEVDVFRVVKQIRDRRPQFINNMEQYKGLYEVAKQYIKRDNVYVNVI